ncbi:protein BIC1 isoform X1 [Cucumis melo var. makuwa]|uniref:Protein BIC1-like n=2 Tax=Cucumis melo TaxID=3656 RepID=A0A9I9DV20_CUCME|nr:protein BIC1-like [Cucumis melo]KAA0025256.1 protein BIC1 isoform X1 [Cucumis melo var. makuwa]TYK07411.1 protein BIC1 isoform X1 [Cucumis melo var. makuwa]
MTLPSPNPNSSLFLPHHDHPHLQESDQTLSEHDPQKGLEEGESSRERLKRHRMAVAGHVWIPDKWGKEEFLKDWIDGSAFEASLFPSGIVSARCALARDAKRLSPNNNTATATATAAAGALRILNSSTC